MKWIKRIALGLVLAAGFLVIGGWIFYKTQMTHHTVSGTPGKVEPTGDRLRDSIRRGIEYLRVQQEPDGEFSAGVLDPKPAFTALVVDAAVRSPEGLDEKTPWVARAVKAIVSQQQPDGGIYTPILGMENYCTAVSIMALARVDRQKYATVIEKARDYQLGIQRGDGGVGYSARGGRADLSNTAMWLESLRKAGIREDSEEFKRCRAYITACQNNSEDNSAAWATDDGGFIYRPGQSKAGSYKDRDGTLRHRSYGLMSYAGLVSFLWAGVDREDRRVRSAMRWVRNNWTLEENRNLRDAGLYYYYMTMAKALSAYGQRQVTESDGKAHDWPVELSEKVMSLQSPDGSWKNSNEQWFESDSILVTAYMVRTLSICHEAVNGGSGGVVKGRK